MKDLTGQRFGRLTVLRFASKKNSNYYWLCKCDCGKETIVSKNHLSDGHTKSCGCFQREASKNFHTIHNMARTKIYSVWNGIKDRCLNNKKKNYKYYGGRGIKVCEEWKNDFLSFYNWAINNGYKEGLTIDRINNEGNYEPNNCRWATHKEQANNTRRNRYITYKGKRQSLANWCRELNIDYQITRGKLRSYTPQQVFGATI